MKHLSVIVFVAVLAVSAHAGRHVLPGVSPAVHYDAAAALEAGDASAETAVICVHGWGGGIKPSGGALERALGPSIPVYAPLFPRRELVAAGAREDDGRAMWGKGFEIAQASNATDWRGGGDAVGTALSSFDVVDAMLAALSDAARFPNLKRVVLAGFSAGGQFVGRYVAVGKGAVRAGIALDYIVVAPSTELRLEDDVTWHYGLKDRPRYPAAASKETILRNLSSRRVWRGCGTADTKPGALDKSPIALRQGENRYARYRNFRNYLKKFPDWAKQVSFHDMPGVGHSGKVWEDPSLLAFIKGTGPVAPVAYDPAHAACVGDLHLPECGVTRDTPVALLIHGGGWSGMGRADVVGIADFYRELGYAVFNVDYRLCGAAAWPACGDDCVKAGRFVLDGGLAKWGLRPEKIHVVGGSAGGHLALWTGLKLGGAKVSDVVAISPIADPAPDCAAHRGRFQALFHAAPTPALLDSMSPMKLIAAGGPRILVTHATDDPVVPFASSANFVDAYRAAGNACDFHTYASTTVPALWGHYIWRPDWNPHRLNAHLENRIRAFLARPGAEIEPLPRPVAYSRDGVIDLFLTNGLYAVRHKGRQDWAVTAFPEVPVKGGDRFSYGLDVVRCGGGICRASVVLRFENGDVRWGYAAQVFRAPGRRTWSFAVPRGAKSVQARFSGAGAFDGAVRNLRLVRQEPLPVADTVASWSAESAELKMEVLPDGGALAVTDRRTGRVWRPRTPLSGAFAVTRARTEGRRIAVELLDYETLRSRTATYALAGAEIDVTVDSDPAAPLSRDGFSFPSAFATEAADALIAPFSEGYRLPFAEKHKSIGSANAYSSALCMPFFGVEDGRDGSGWVAILATPDDAGLQAFADATGRMDAVAPLWRPRHGTFGYARRVKLAFLAKGGYVAMAKRYRAEAEREGLVKTFREKAKARPNVDRLLGAANVWYFGGGVDAVEMAKELKAAGIGRFLWSANGSPDVVKALAAMPDVLVGRYDCYRDVYHPAQLAAMGAKVPPPTDEICRNTSAWPEDIVWNSADSNDWRKAWGVRDRKGNKVYCATQCDLRAVARERRNVSAELKLKPFNARFIDVTAAVGWEECEHPAHPMDRSQSRAAKCELLRILGDEFGLVVGSEQGIGAAVPVCDYFEGMLSPWYARMPHGRPGAGRMEIFRDPARPTNVTEKELEIVERYTTGEKYRIPLFELVFHDCCCAHWYWYDYSNRPLYLWPRRDLLNALYGTMPMFIFDARHWREHKAEFQRSYATTAPIARRTGYSEMLDHRALTKDRSVQESVFADGTRVTVNFGDKPFRLPDGTDLAPGAVRDSGAL